MSVAKTYRVGVIGMGFIGKVHAMAYQTLPYYYDDLGFAGKVVGVCCARRESAEKGCRLVGADLATTDYRAITENPDIDIVNVCSPNDRHLGPLLSAIRNGKHVYCDKPLVADLEEAGRVRAVAAETHYDKTFQMTFQTRFFPAIVRAKQLLEEGFIGEPLEFRAIFLHSGNADPETPLKWKMSGAAGGGVIADLGSHVLDLVHYLLGDFAELIAEPRTAYPDRPAAGDPKRRVPVDAEDRVMLLTHLKSGVHGLIEATKLATGAEDELRLEIHGAKGALRFNSMEPHYLGAYDARAAASPIGGRRGWTAIETGQRFPKPGGAFPGGKLTMGWLRTHIACLYNFMKDVHVGAPGDPGLAQGLYIQKLLDIVRRSANERRWLPAD